MTANAKRKQLVRERLEAAEGVCWSLILAMSVGGLDIPMEDRQFLAQPMEKWVSKAVKCGLFKHDGEDDSPE